MLLHHFLQISQILPYIYMI